MLDIIANGHKGNFVSDDMLMIIALPNGVGHIGVGLADDARHAGFIGIDNHAN